MANPQSIVITGVVATAALNTPAIAAGIFNAYVGGYILSGGFSFLQTGVLALPGQMKLQIGPAGAPTLDIRSIFGGAGPADAGDSYFASGWSRGIEIFGGGGFDNRNVWVNSVNCTATTFLYRFTVQLPLVAAA